MDAALDAGDSCGCAPSIAERRTFWQKGTVTRRNALGIGALGVAALSAFGIGAGVNAAYAATYPSWDDVQNAKNNEAAKAGEVTRIQNLISSLTQQVADTQAAAELAGNEYYEAQQAYFDAIAKANAIQAQADEQSLIADESARKAGQVAAQLYRNGGDDTALELFFAGSAANADELLSRLGTMDKLLEYNQSVYDNAVAARNSAQSLSDQAAVARTERDRLQKVAEEKMVAAQAAADAAQAALDEQTANLSTLQAQLAALQDETTKTVAGYQAGVAAEAARRAAEEQARRAAEAAAAAAAAANNGGGGGGGGGGDGGGGGAVGSGGWVRPQGGFRSSGYGARSQQCNSNGCSSSYHYGVDLANGCGAQIYAAQSGTVDYASWNGGYGNYVRIDHGGGIGTGYGHISSFAVRRGDWVNAGQVIAYAGNTGGSFGCHLHFEVYIWGEYTNPIYFMADRGVSV
ncbi:peptidase M23 [Microbacterium sp. CH12i]|uniref:M23 family metallopeptidase n=1 Tax=Microbacterium sp. CH12i TaxID=1479651 RepID=UPI000461B707|nr:M23 family metallopeptidase [Microbacterium sp. CH12i]KDA05405.1 peptidase M23 [Microbacterium sp. CH12i]